MFCNNLRHKTMQLTHTLWFIKHVIKTSFWAVKSQSQLHVNTQNQLIWFEYTHILQCNTLLYLLTSPLPPSPSSLSLSHTHTHAHTHTHTHTHIIQNHMNAKKLQITSIPLMRKSETMIHLATLAMDHWEGEGGGVGALHFWNTV